MRRARPPVGVQSTEEQVEQSTTDWEWEKTVVLHGSGAIQAVSCSEA